MSRCPFLAMLHPFVAMRCPFPAMRCLCRAMLSQVLTTPRHAQLNLEMEKSEAKKHRGPFASLVGPGRFLKEVDLPAWIVAD